MTKNRGKNGLDNDMTTQLGFDAGDSSEALPLEAAYEEPETERTVIATPSPRQSPATPRKKEVEQQLVTPATEDDSTEFGILAGTVAGQMLALEERMRSAVPPDEATAEFDVRLNSLCELRLLYQRMSSSYLEYKNSFERSQAANAAITEDLANKNTALREYVEKCRKLEALLQRMQRVLDETSRANGTASAEIREILSSSSTPKPVVLGSRKPLPKLPRIRLQGVKGVSLETIKKRPEVAAAAAVGVAVPVVIGPKVAPSIPFIVDISAGIILGAVAALAVAKFKKS